MIFTFIKMEEYKKYGRSAFAKHLRRKKGKWTKTMANGKSRSKSKLDIKDVFKSEKSEVQQKSPNLGLFLVSNFIF